VVDRLKYFPSDSCTTAIGNIIGKNGENKNSLELDGVIIGYDRSRRRLVACLIEAKTSKGGSESDSVKHIRRVRKEFFAGGPWIHSPVASKKATGYSSAWIYSSIRF
jgi:hypothetical protein